MAHPYWFGVTVEFLCKSCGRTSIEKYGANAPSNDIEKLKIRINSQPLYCLHCRTPTADGTEVKVGILPDTRESLFRLGYEVPEMPGDK
jgi:hypothetical protein